MPTSRTSAIAGASLAGRALGGVRVIIGLSALLAPSLVIAPWVGRGEATRSSVRLLGRTLAGRDLALGIGAVLATDTTLSTWLFLGAMADVCDAGATVASFSKLPELSRWLVLVLTSGAALGGLMVGLATISDSSSVG